MRLKPGAGVSLPKRGWIAPWESAEHYHGGHSQLRRYTAEQVVN